MIQTIIIALIISVETIVLRTLLQYSPDIWRWISGLVRMGDIRIISAVIHHRRPLINTQSQSCFVPQSPPPLSAGNEGWWLICLGTKPKPFELANFQNYDCYLHLHSKVKERKGRKSKLDSSNSSDSMSGDTQSRWQLPDSAVAAGCCQPVAVFSVRQRHLPFRGDGAASVASGSWRKWTRSPSGVETPARTTFQKYHFYFVKKKNIHGNATIVTSTLSKH